MSQADSSPGGRLPRTLRGPGQPVPRLGLALVVIATAQLVPGALRRDPDDRWAAAFGRIAGYSFAVAVVSGVLLLPFFRPSMATVAYHGSTASWTASR